MNAQQELQKLMERHTQLGTTPLADGTASVDGLTVLAVSDGHKVGSVLTVLRGWLNTYINVIDDLDIDLLTLWAAHTHVCLETYSTPRLILDSTMPGSGKTTVLEHLQRFSLRPIQAASLSSPAMIPRMLDKEIRTILIDEVDRSLDPKKPGVEDLIAILNSGYKRGATRPVLVPTKGGGWDVSEMPTFAPVCMAGNAPNLPDDTRSRSIRVLLMPDLYGTVSESDWEEIEPGAHELAKSLIEAMDGAREFIRTVRPTLPPGCVGRLKEKWSPLARVAAAAGGAWPEIANQLIERDIKEVQLDRDEGLSKLPPAMILLTDLQKVWKESEPFLPSMELIERLVQQNSDYWGDQSPYGKRLTQQRVGKLLAQGAKIHSSKNGRGERGYARDAFGKAWRQLGLDPSNEPSQTVQTVKPSNQMQPTVTESFGSATVPPCSACGLPMHPSNARFGTHPNCDVGSDS